MEITILPGTPPAHDGVPEVWSSGARSLDKVWSHGGRWRQNARGQGENWTAERRGPRGVGEAAEHPLGWPPDSKVGGRSVGWHCSARRWPGDDVPEPTYTGPIGSSGPMRRGKLPVASKSRSQEAPSPVRRVFITDSAPLEGSKARPSEKTEALDVTLSTPATTATEYSIGSPDSDSDGDSDGSAAAEVPPSGYLLRK